MSDKPDFAAEWHKWCSDLPDTTPEGPELLQRMYDLGAASRDEEVAEREKLRELREAGKALATATARVIDWVDPECTHKEPQADCPLCAIRPALQAFIETLGKE